MQRTKKLNKKIIDGSKLKIGIVVSKFNSDITEKMLTGALEVLEKNKVKKENIKIVRVPGAFEISLACLRLAKTKKYNALSALGCIIRGETEHHHYLSLEVSRGIMEVMLKYNIPIGFGVITVNNLKQARDRSGEKNNKGAEAAEAGLGMVKI
jgi:6,7-dimethyl-8-ribityllumazine synthase